MPTSPVPETPDDVHFDLAGSELSEIEAKALEAGIAKAPDTPESLISRKKLLSYYHREGDPKQQKLLLWFIQNHPTDGYLLGGRRGSQVSLALDPLSYREVGKAWEAQLKAQPENPRVIASAAQFFLQDQPQRAEVLLKQGRTLEPDNPEWISQLALLYQLDGMVHRPPYPEGSAQENARQLAARKALELREELLSLSKADREMYFYELTSVPQAALHAGDYAAAQRYAEELLRLTADYQDNWNYDTALYRSLHTLGLLALRHGDIEEAKKQLLIAGKTPGQYGVKDFQLAYELLDRGEISTARAFLDELTRSGNDGHGLAFFREEVEAAEAK